MQRIRRLSSAALVLCCGLLAACATSTTNDTQRSAEKAAAATSAAFDVIVRNGMVYDGSGAPARRADVGIRGDRVTVVGDLAGAKAITEIDATGKAVAPGFINVLSWANRSLIADGRGMSDLKQGVTLEIMGEGESGGPLSAAMKADILKQQGDIKFEIDWTTLGEFLDSLVRRGVSPNVASFVGATSVRMVVLGEDDRDPTPAELAQMQDLVRAAMREGALGVGSSLIYAPAFFAETPELIALAKAAAESGGGYISHVRNESYRLEAAIDELIEITRAAGGHGEVYHLKAAGEANWGRMASAIAKIEQARQPRRVRQRQHVHLHGRVDRTRRSDAAVGAGRRSRRVGRAPEGSGAACTRRATRSAIPRPARKTCSSLPVRPTACCSSRSGIRRSSISPARRSPTCMKMRGTSAEDTIIDLVIEDNSRVQTVYFLMSEDNVKLGLSQPWVSLGSDAEALAPEGVFMKSSTHPRAYGNFARLLGKYSRDEQLMPLEEAVRRLTQLPATHWKLQDRGCLDARCFADVVVFDPAAIADKATFDEPKQYAVGVEHVLVNGVPVIRNGEHTGAKPGRVVRGPGYRP